MTHFDTIRNTKPEDTEIGSLYAIYGRDDEEKEHFLILGTGAAGAVLIVDISDGQYVARERDRDDSALEVAEFFGLTNNIRFFGDQDDFDLMITF